MREPPILAAAGPCELPLGATGTSKLLEKHPDTAEGGEQRGTGAEVAMQKVASVSDSGVGGIFTPFATLHVMSC